MRCVNCSNIIDGQNRGVVVMLDQGCTFDWGLVLLCQTYCAGEYDFPGNTTVIADVDEDTDIPVECQQGEGPGPDDSAAERRQLYGGAL